MHTESKCVELVRSRLLHPLVHRLQPGMVLTLAGGPGTGKTVFLRQLQQRVEVATSYVDLARFSADSAVFVSQIERISARLWPEIFPTSLVTDREKALSGTGSRERAEALFDELLLRGDSVLSR